MAGFQPTLYGRIWVTAEASRAKLLMMLESMVSLVTIIVVAARAINIIGS